MHPTPEPKGHSNGYDEVLCFGTVYIASDGVMKCCPKCGAFFNPGEPEPVGHNLDAAQDHLGA